MGTNIFEQQTHSTIKELVLKEIFSNKSRIELSCFQITENLLLSWLGLHFKQKKLAEYLTIKIASALASTKELACGKFLMHY